MIRRNPLQPSTKRMTRRHRAIGAPTKAEQAHQDAQRAHGCAMCLLLGMERDAMRERFGPSLQHHKRDFLAVIAGNLGERSTAALQRWQDEQIARSA